MALKGIGNRIYRKARDLALRGNNYYCPLCEKGYSKFLTSGLINIRPNAECPGCGSLERHRLLWTVITQLWKTNKISKGGRMLHVAPESILTSKFQRDYDYLSVDLDGAIAMEAMDITAINRPDNTFDAIVCNHVMEHIPEDYKALSELYRVLKPGGWASLQVPPMLEETTAEDFSIVDPEERKRLYGQEDHVRRYGKDYRYRLEKAGFEVLMFPKTEVLNPEMLKKISVECENEVWICLKN